MCSVLFNRVLYSYLFRCFFIFFFIFSALFFAVFGPPEPNHLAAQTIAAGRNRYLNALVRVQPGTDWRCALGACRRRRKERGEQQVGKPRHHHDHPTPARR
eukprot:TRINITY_DN143951_c0_g1_i1.p1 TRINITY_DN143951_c0_g1~~TRINITY_DN143951_c0_g1_i1.p1  ORF type:complete len:117 (-),score=7.35 TRINITY_DN143951_c0_g1_i1:197-499(-)